MEKSNLLLGEEGMGLFPLILTEKGIYVDKILHNDHEDVCDAK